MNKEELTNQEGLLSDDEILKIFSDVHAEPQVYGQEVAKAQYARCQQEKEEAVRAERERIGKLFYEDTNNGVLPTSEGLAQVIMQPYIKALKEGK